MNMRTVGWGMALILVAAIAMIGCSGDKQNTLAPSTSSAQAKAGDELGVSWRWVDAAHTQIEKTYYVVGRDVHGQTVSIGPLKVVYWCDYPLGTYGPPSPGHCYTDGSGCVDP